MKAFVDLFWNLCLLRVGPEQMPRSGLFVVTVLLLNVALSFLVALSSPFSTTPLAAFALPVIAAAVLASGTWLVLQARGLQERFIATITALLGADAVLTFLSWPLVATMQIGTEATTLDLILSLGQFALLFWWITVAGFVFARALSMSRSQGIAVAVFIVLTTLLVNASVFPPPTAAPTTSDSPLS